METVKESLKKAMFGDALTLDERNSLIPLYVALSKIDDSDVRTMRGLVVDAVDAGIAGNIGVGEFTKILLLCDILEFGKLK